MTKSIFLLFFTISLIPFFKKALQAQSLSNFVPQEAHITTVFTPFLLTEKENKDIQEQVWFKDAIFLLNEFFIDKISPDSLADLLLNKSIKIGLDNTKPWFFTSQQMENGIVHYALVIPPFNLKDWLPFVQKNQSLYQPTNLKSYKGYAFYIAKNDMLLSWNKDHIAIQKFVLPNPYKYKAYPVQNALYIENYLLPYIFSKKQNITSLKNKIINDYNAFSVHLNYKEMALSIGIDFLGKGDMVLAHCILNKPNALLNILGVVPTSKIYFKISDNLPFYNQYPALKTIADKKILLQVKDANTYDLSMQISRKEVLQLVEAFYQAK